MHKYDYSFLKKNLPGNIVGLTDIIAKVPDISVKTVELVLSKGY